MNDKKGRRKYILVLGLFGQAGILIAAPVIVCTAGGYLLDKYFHTAPLFVISGTILGFAVSIYNAYKMMREEETSG